MLVLRCLGLPLSLVWSPIVHNHAFVYILTILCLPAVSVSYTCLAMLKCQHCHVLYTHTHYIQHTQHTTSPHCSCTSDLPWLHQHKQNCIHTTPSTPTSPLLLHWSTAFPELSYTPYCTLLPPTHAFTLYTSLEHNEKITWVHNCIHTAHQYIPPLLTIHHTQHCIATPSSHTLHLHCLLHIITETHCHIIPHSHTSTAGSS